MWMNWVIIETMDENTGVGHQPEATVVVLNFLDEMPEKPVITRQRLGVGVINTGQELGQSYRTCSSTTQSSKMNLVTYRGNSSRSTISGLHET
ncbi:hypothetical protein PHPALM_17017 [Phytophthora palmivora]|uniref:Uncharacterized protein n=1 Tax=Phytophthora palmivora TaxID=4796 RepID=A0A2P4XNG5_9STRA|nr:hypothetical protein PHPALM_17017 [Phytophthora palmivora]